MRARRARRLSPSRTCGAARSARRPVKAEVAGSNPVRSAARFRSRLRDSNLVPGRVAQLVERAPEKREVTGSTPVPTTCEAMAWLAARLGPAVRPGTTLDKSVRSRSKVPSCPELSFRITLFVPTACPHGTRTSSDLGLFLRSTNLRLIKESPRLNAKASAGALIHFKMFTARATTNKATTSEIASSAIIISFIHGRMAETSVGLNAVAVANEKWK